MKLSDLIFESQILLEDKFEIRKTPNGRMWGVYNTTVTPNVLVSSHKTKNQANIKADQLRNPTPPKPKDSSGKKSPRSDRNKIKTPAKVSTPSTKLMPGVHQVGANKWTVFLPDGKSTVDLENGNDAKKLDRYIKSLVDKGTSADEITKQLRTNPGGFLAEADITDTKKVGKVKNSAINRKITQMSVNQFMKEVEARRVIDGFKNTGIGKWLTTGPAQWLFKLASFKIVGTAGATFALFLGTTNALSQIQLEMAQAQGNPQRLSKLEEEARIVQGQAVILFSAFIIALCKDIKSLRTITGWFRGALKTAFTVFGIKGRVAGILIGEAISTVFFIALALPATQRFVAQTLQDWVLGDFFGAIGGGLDTLLQAADSAFEGRFGTGFLADKLTIDAVKSEGPTGEYYSDSEWAKKVFGALLFPEGDETKFVPFIPEQKREDLLNSIMAPEQKQTSQDAADTAISNKMDSDNAAVQPQPATA